MVYAMKSTQADSGTENGGLLVKMGRMVVGRGRRPLSRGQLLGGSVLAETTVRANVKGDGAWP